MNFAAACALKFEHRRVLLVTVTSGIGVWEHEVATHCPLPWVTMTPEGGVTGHGEGLPEYAGRPPIKFMVVNFPNVYQRMTIEGHSWAPMPHPALVDFSAQVMIIDESHHIGNPTAVTSKMCYQLGRLAAIRVIMTGTMFHRKPFFTFGQAKFYDDGMTFGSSFSHFKKRIAVFGGYGGYEVKRYKNLKWMTKLMKRWVHMEDYVPPRDTASTMVPVHLTGEGLQRYAEMEKEGVVTFDDGQVVVSEIVLAKHMRCQMIAGGWLKLADGGYRRVGNDKLRIATDRFQSYADAGIHKFVVGVQYVPEIADAAIAAKRAGYEVVLFHGGIPRGNERTRRVKHFVESNRPTAFISQIDAGKESINLSVADTMCFYSLSPSFVKHDQFSRRIEKYQDERVLQYDFLVAQGTRDQVTYEALKLKQDVATFIQDHPTKVEEITAKSLAD